MQGIGRAFILGAARAMQVFVLIFFVAVALFVLFGLATTGSFYIERELIAPIIKLVLTMAFFGIVSRLVLKKLS